MSFLKELGLILGLCLLGEGIALLLPIPFPGSVVSMGLLFLLLALPTPVGEHHVSRMGNFLLQNMAFFFIPAGVGILEYAQLMKEQGLVLVVICFVTMIFTFGATALTIRGVSRLLSRKAAGREADAHVE